MAPKTKKKRFTIPTAMLVGVWSEAIANETSWEAMCMHLWDELQKDEQLAANNKPALDEDDIEWASWSNEGKYKFISERASRKAVLVRKTVKSDYPKRDVEQIMPFPDGYHRRPGGSGAMSTGAILKAFGQTP